MLRCTNPFVPVPRAVCRPEREERREGERGGVKEGTEGREVAVKNRG